MSVRTVPPRLRALGLPALGCALALAAGCQTAPPTAAVPPPPVQLLEAGRFDLPAACTVTPGRSYRMSYTVGTDGRTGRLGAITPGDAPTCLQAALEAWVSSFRYAPPAQPETVTADWMLVTASRGS
jgi:hypothetical protein